MPNSTKIVSIRIVRYDPVTMDDKYGVLVGTRWRQEYQDGFSGISTEINPRFDTLPRARHIAKELRDTYKAMGHLVFCNMRPERG